MQETVRIIRRHNLDRVRRMASAGLVTIVLFWLGRAVVVGMYKVKVLYLLILW